VRACAIQFTTVIPSSRDRDRTVNYDDDDNTFLLAVGVVAMLLLVALAVVALVVA
jgi:hypothetical protein